MMNYVPKGVISLFLTWDASKMASFYPIEGALFKEFL
jgi:hypothetical protein